MFVMNRNIPLKACIAMAIAAAAFSFFAVGCNRTQTGQQALEKQLAASGQTMARVAPFSGMVTIDGKPPEIPKGRALLVMLYEPKNPPTKTKPARRALVAKNGYFAFQTYESADGVPEGSYVLLFAELQPRGHGAFVGPDGLKNAYNDPDKNEKNPTFNVTVTAPGKTDYSFELPMAGTDQAEPGPHAITKIERPF
jgi:hypothetical protein